MIRGNWTMPLESQPVSSPKIYELGALCKANRFGNTNVIRSANVLMHDFLGSIPANTDLYEHQLFLTANTLARCAMPPHVVAAGLLSYPVQESQLTGILSKTLPIIQMYNRLMSYPKPSIPGSSTVDYYQSMLLSGSNPLDDRSDGTRELFFAHMLRAANQFSRLRLETSGGEFALGDMQIEAQLATSTALFLRRLGMEELAGEMLDYTFSILNSSLFESTLDHINLSAGQQARKSFLDGTKVILGDFLVRRAQSDVSGPGMPGINFSVSGRLKSILSTSRKLEMQADVRDMIGLRVVISGNLEIDDINELRNKQLGCDQHEFQRLQQKYDEACALAYRCRDYVYELAGEMGWTEVEGVSRDYISSPRENGYQALQLTFRTEEGLPFEVQIRTKGMDRWAEIGGASHVYYKTGEASHNFGLTTRDPFARFLQLRDQIRNEHRQYGFLYAGINPEGIKDITGPFEIIPDIPERQPTALDLLVAAGDPRALYCDKAFIFDPETAKEKGILPFYPIPEDVLLRANFGQKAGTSQNWQKKVATDEASHAIESARLAQRFGVDNIEAAARTGRNIIEQALAKSRSLPLHPSGTKLTVEVLVPEPALVKRMGFASMDDMALVLGKERKTPDERKEGQKLQDQLEALIKELAITVEYDPASNKAVFVTQRHPQVMQMILNQIAGQGFNLSSATMQPEGDRLVLSADFEEFSPEDFTGLTKSLQQPARIPVAEDLTIDSYSKERTITLDIREDRPGIINDIFRELMNNGCLVTSFNFLPGLRKSEIKVMFPRGFSRDKMMGHIPLILARIGNLSKATLSD